MRVALVSGPDPGHLLPTAGLALRLRASGHDSVVATGVDWERPLTHSGIRFVELPLLAAATPFEGFGDRLASRPVQMARPLADALRDFAPDVVVSDTLTRAGPLAAELLELPWVELIPHNLPDPSVALPPFGTGWRPNRLRDRPFRMAAARSVRIGEREQRRAVVAAGLRRRPAAHRMVATLPGLEPPRPDWPAHTSIVGPMAWDPAPVDLPIPAGSAPIVLVVGSTASGAASSMLGACVSALAEGRVRIVSPCFASPDLSMPPWVSAGPGRLLPLLSVADVVVSTGGHGMVCAALRAGVPLVVMPGAGDQKEVAARVVRAGAAVAATPKSLREKVFRVIDDVSYAKRAKELGRCAGVPDPVKIVIAAAEAG